MKEILLEVGLNLGMLAGVLFIIPVMMHKALYIFAKVTYDIAHKKH